MKPTQGRSLDLRSAVFGLMRGLIGGTGTGKSHLAIATRGQNWTPIRGQFCKPFDTFDDVSGSRSQGQKKEEPYLLFRIILTI
jgi:hypothetical protein